MPSAVANMPDSTIARERELALSVMTKFLTSRREGECPICYEA